MPQSLECRIRSISQRDWIISLGMTFLQASGIFTMSQVPQARAAIFSCLNFPHGIYTPTATPCTVPPISFFHLCSLQVLVWCIPPCNRTPGLSAPIFHTAWLLTGTWLSFLDFLWPDPPPSIEMFLPSSGVPN